MVPDGEAGQDVYVVLRAAIAASGMAALSRLVIARRERAVAMVKLARQLIERQAGKFQPADLEDHYEARLREVIEAKLKGEGIKPEVADEPHGDNVVDLMAALKRSLGARAGKEANTRLASHSSASVVACAGHSGGGKLDPVSLRGAKRRGNLHLGAQRDGDCFVADAPRNDSRHVRSTGARAGARAEHL